MLLACYIRTFMIFTRGIRPPVAPARARGGSWCVTKDTVRRETLKVESRQILVMGHTDPTAFLRGAMDPPSEAAVAAAMQTLADVQAVGPTGPRARARERGIPHARAGCAGELTPPGLRGDVTPLRLTRDVTPLG